MSRAEAAALPVPDMFLARVWFDMETGQKHYDVYPLDNNELSLNVLANHQPIKPWHMQRRQPRAWKPTRTLPRMSSWGAAAIDYTPAAAMLAARRKAGEIS